MSRKKRKLVAQETLRIMERGEYVNACNDQISIAESLASAVRGTELIRPQDFDSLSLPVGEYSTQFEVHNETTYAGAQALLADGASQVCSLNFASAKNPGGGFLGGSQAQEEALTRASGLYDCLQQQMAYYEFHRRGSGNCLYSHHMIYSPAVPVFRDDTDELLDRPWLTSIITSPAVNAGALTNNAPELLKQVEPVMRERIDRVLLLAASRGHRALVLGAWGCGVFRNDPAVIAGLLNDSLATDRFKSVFERVRFSVLDTTEHKTTFEAFRKMF